MHVNVMPVAGMPVLPWPCVNQGGPSNLVLLEIIQILEKVLALPLDSVRALAFLQVIAGRVIALKVSEQRYFCSRLTSVADTVATVVPFVELPHVQA
jgi:hypothetical protein